ncbi:MAG TPA: hypothetical protein VF690_18345, partial [Hymenobacter sp.]
MMKAQAVGDGDQVALVNHEISEVFLRPVVSVSCAGTLASPRLPRQLRHLKGFEGVNANVAAGTAGRSVPLLPLRS